MWFGRKCASQMGTIVAADGQNLQLVSTYKYLGDWIDSNLSFADHLTKLQSKVKARLSFLYRNRSFIHHISQANPGPDDGSATV